MTLQSYQRKRNFKKTTEPRAKLKRTSSKALQFVMQKHAASHLHYDLRLEINGVLKSWAVPKGPSLNPHDKRLAVQVEDHPFGYLHFEGEIPKGEYGAGDVIVWDTGTWQCEGDPATQYKKGKLVFTLHGKKLKGKWALIRTRLAGSGKTNWLWFKEKDKYANDKIDITAAKPSSVLSRRGIRIKEK